MKIYIKDFKVGEKIDSILLVKQKDLRKTQKGDPYLTLKLIDKTGEIEGRWWDGFADIVSQIKDNSYLRIYAEVSEYQGNKQLTIKKAILAKDTEFDPSDFLKQTKKDVAELWQNVCGILQSIQDPEINKLITSFVTDPVYSAKFPKAPAAMAMHSAYLGGLLEHTENMLNLALFICGQYPQINRDILLAGIFLHDIGKIEEMDYKASIKYTDEGKLVGHIVMGIKILDKQIEKMGGIAEQKRIILEHLIASHHGTGEFGSPKLPTTLEAVVLHYIDNIDAKIVGFTEFVENNPPDANGWTTRAFAFDNRQLFVPKK